MEPNNYPIELMRLEQIAPVKKLIEQKMSELLQTGKNPTKIKFNIVSFPGESRLQIELKIDFKSMKHPSDPESVISLEELTEMVTGSLSIQGEIVPEIWEKRETEGEMI